MIQHLTTKWNGVKKQNLHLLTNLLITIMGILYIYSRASL